MGFQRFSFCVIFFCIFVKSSRGETENPEKKEGDNNIGETSRYEDDYGDEEYTARKGPNIESSRQTAVTEHSTTSVSPVSGNGSDEPPVQMIQIILDKLYEFHEMMAKAIQKLKIVHSLGSDRGDGQSQRSAKGETAVTDVSTENTTSTERQSSTELRSTIAETTTKAPRRRRGRGDSSYNQQRRKNWHPATRRPSRTTVRPTSEPTTRRSSRPNSRRRTPKS